MNFHRLFMIVALPASLAVFLLPALLFESIRAQSPWQWYKVDPHVHSSVSADAYVDLGIISQAAQAAGYDAIFVTDHNAGSSFQINGLTANHVEFDDKLVRWEPGTYGDLAATAADLVSVPVNTGASALHLLSSSAANGETYIELDRGPNMRSGDIILRVAIRPVRIDPGSGVYVSASFGGDPRVVKNPYGYTTRDGVVTPRKSTVLVWQLGAARTPSSDPMARVLTYDLGPYTLNAWNFYTINVSQAFADIPAADLPLDYNGLVHLKLATAANGGAAEAYFDTYSVDAAAPVAPADEFVYRNSVMHQFDTPDFTLFAGAELGQQRHTQRFNFDFQDPGEFRLYQDGSDSIPDTHATGFLAQLNHPGVTITGEEVATTLAHGADVVETREEDHVEAWEEILEQGVVLLGQWSSDSHTGSLGTRPASFLYAPMRTLPALLKSMYEGRSFSAIGNFQGALVFNLAGSPPEPYPARYPVFVSADATSADVHLQVTGDVSPNHRVDWIVDGAAFSSDFPGGTTHGATKTVPLDGAFTYVRAEVLRPTMSRLAATQPLFFFAVNDLPTAMRFYVTNVDTPNGIDYTNTRVHGITRTAWYAGAPGLAIDLENPPGALVDLRLEHGAPPAQLYLDGQPVASAGSAEAFAGIPGSTWYYDPASQLLRIRVRHAAAASYLFVAYGPVGTAPPTAPGALAAAAQGNSAVILRWLAAGSDTGVHRYIVLRDGAEYASVAGTATTYVDPGVAPGSTYTYAVAAVDPIGNRSPISNAATAVVPQYATRLFLPIVSTKLRPK
jgi:hypothetical protein